MSLLPFSEKKPKKIYNRTNYHDQNLSLKWGFIYYLNLCGGFSVGFFLDPSVALYIVQLQVCLVDLILFQLLSPVWDPQLQILRFYKQYYYVKNTRTFCGRSFIPIDDELSLFFQTQEWLSKIKRLARISVFSSFLNSSKVFAFVCNQVIHSIS